MSSNGKAYERAEEQLRTIAAWRIEAGGAAIRQLKPFFNDLGSACGRFATKFLLEHAYGNERSKFFVSQVPTFLDQLAASGEVGENALRALGAVITRVTDEVRIPILTTLVDCLAVANIAQKRAARLLSTYFGYCYGNDREEIKEVLPLLPKLKAAVLVPAIRDDIENIITGIAWYARPEVSEEIIRSLAADLSIANRAERAASLLVKIARNTFSSRPELRARIVELFCDNLHLASVRVTAADCLNSLSARAGELLPHLTKLKKALPVPETHTPIKRVLESGILFGAAEPSNTDPRVPLRTVLESFSAAKEQQATASRVPIDLPREESIMTGPRDFEGVQTFSYKPASLFLAIAIVLKLLRSGWLDKKVSLLEEQCAQKELDLARALSISLRRKALREEAERLLEAGALTSTQNNLFASYQDAASKYSSLHWWRDRAKNVQWISMLTALLLTFRAAHHNRNRT